MTLLFVLIVIFSIAITDINPLSQTVFSYRYNDYIQRSDVSEWAYGCTCPEINSDDLCTCNKMAVDKYVHPIEGPYAALMIQLDCFNDEIDPTIVSSITTIYVVSIITLKWFHIQHYRQKKRIV